jgi:peptidoglycan hydrolase-like protein with peptidoglycan-binding domain
MQERRRKKESARARAMSGALAGIKTWPRALARALRRALTGIKTWPRVLARFRQWLTRPRRVGKWKIKPRFFAISAAFVLVCVVVVVLSVTVFGHSPAAVARMDSSSAAAAPAPGPMPPAPDEAAAEAAAVPTLPVATTPPEPQPTPFQLRKGMHSEEVIALQERLMELDYMDQDMPTDYFGPATEYALELFQRKHGLKIDGIYGAETKRLLFSDEAKRYTVSIGISGTDVREIQERLKELDYLDKVTGYFGEETEAAVKEFQKRNGLTVDGTVGVKTKDLLFSDQAKAFYYSYGTTGEEVLKLQERLFKLGYLTTKPDGKFGKDTENAIRRFQQTHGFIDDGYAGPQTRAMLFSDKAEKNALMVGDSGSDVRNVQQRLIELKYLSGKADGYFGSNTEAAVKAFQKNNKLTVDGKVGPRTMSVLLSDSAKKAPAKSSGGGSSSGSKPGKTAQESKVDELIRVAKSKLGAKYVRGAKGPNAFDCSGFVYWCLKQIGVKQGYMTSAGWAATKKYPVVEKISDLKAGDIISFKGHVGIALGGGKMIDSAPSGNGVRITSLSHPYWQKNFIRGYRVL